MVVLWLSLIFCFISTYMTQLALISQPVCRQLWSTMYLRLFVKYLLGIVQLFILIIRIINFNAGLSLMRIPSESHIFRLWSFRSFLSWWRRYIVNPWVFNSEDLRGSLWAVLLGVFYYTGYLSEFGTQLNSAIVSFLRSCILILLHLNLETGVELIVHAVRVVLGQAIRLKGS
jgi:hypothetical protein